MVLVLIAMSEWRAAIGAARWPVDYRVMVLSAGPEHCDRQRATVLETGWPVGTRIPGNDGVHWRQYVRDPVGVLEGFPLRTALDLHAILPTDARSTGYRYNNIEIWLASSDQDDVVYAVGGGGIERWPRAEPIITCA